MNKRKLSAVDEDKTESSVLAEMRALLDQSLRRLESVEERMSQMECEISDLKKVNSSLQKEKSTLENKYYTLHCSMKTLGDNVEWRNRAPTPTQAYWQERGLNDDQEMDWYIGTIDCIKEATRKIRRGQCVEDGFDIELGSFDSSELAGTIFHDEAFMPHWKELADALVEYPYVPYSHSSDKFVVSKVQLPSVVLNMLTPGLARRQNLYELSLFGIEFDQTREGINFAVNMLQRNQLIEFGWSYCGEVNNADSNRLFNTVAQHPSLEIVKLDSYLNMDDANGYDNLMSLLTTKPKLRTIFYRSNNVRTAGDTRLFNWIASNPPLDLLAIDTNELEDGDALRIAEALKYNTTLRRLDIGGNRFTETGCAALKRAIYDKTSLNALSDSNHTCDINLHLHDTLVNFWGPKKSRSAKLYGLFSSRNKKGTNVDCMQREMGEDGDFMQLLPHILSCMQHYYNVGEVGNAGSQFVHPLSILFEIMRKNPGVYER